VGGPGYYFIRRRDAILGLQFVVSVPDYRIRGGIAIRF
jgi:hypothetical protein